MTRPTPPVACGRRREGSAGAGVFTRPPSPTRRRSHDVRHRAVRRTLPAPGTVTMYTTTWCGYCRRLKSQMEREGIGFTEVDIERDPAPPSS